MYVHCKCIFMFFFSELKKLTHSKFSYFINQPQVRYENDPESAIVQFTSPQEAKKAHDATEAVLNNRFIKVYYLKNTGGGHRDNTIKTVVRTIRHAHHLLYMYSIICIQYTVLIHNYMYMYFNYLYVITL